MQLSRNISQEDLTAFAEMSVKSPDADQTIKSLTNFQLRNQLIKLSIDCKAVGYLIEQVVTTEADLIQIMIASKFQRKGHATNALQQWIEQLQARGVESIFLEVREGNEAAKNLYKRKGFYLCGQRSGYYEYKGTIQDAWLLRLDL